METLDITPKVKSTRGRKKGNGSITVDVVEMIVQRRAVGQPIGRIARELGLARNTVRSHLAKTESQRQLDRRRVETLVPYALEAIEKALKAGDARIAMQLVERLGVLDRPGIGTTSDTVLTSALSTFSAAITASTTRVPVRPADPSSREGPGGDLSLPVPIQNFTLDVQPIDSTGDSHADDQTGLGGESAPGSAPAGATPAIE